MLSKIVKMAMFFVVLVGSICLARYAVADIQSGWLATGDVQLAKIVNLPANLLPAQSNRDCTNLSYTTPSGTTASDCFVTSVYSQMASSGGQILLNNTTLGFSLTGFNYDNYQQIPVPNQGITAAVRNAPLTGSYLYFYTNIARHLTPTYDYVNGLSKQVGYAVNAPPDFGFVDKNNKPLPVNTYGTLGFSSNSAWMVADLPGRGFVRVNLATFDVLPFAPSLNGPSDYGSYLASVAISDDGHFAAIASNDYSYFRIYDLTTCSGTTNDDYSQLLDCQSRDYRPVLDSKLNSFGVITSIRFVNDDNLQVTLSYDKTGPNAYSVATYRLTAPGRQANGIDYLALGDSYASGQGEFVYKGGTDTDTDTCHLSPLSYPLTIGAGLFNSYKSVACSGAVTDDINDTSNKYPKNNPQSKGMSDKSYDDQIYSNYLVGYRSQIQFVKKYQPKIATLSIGGNNIGFVDMLVSCVKPTVSSIPAYEDNKTCYNTYDERMGVVAAIDSLYSTLQQTYTQLMQADPGVQLYVTGYPQVAVQGNCGGNVHLNRDEIQFSQQLIQYLDWTIERAATSVGARYVDIQQALAGSRLCEAKGSALAMNGITAGNDIAIAGVKAIGNESFHPNVLGHQLIARALLDKTHNLTQPMPTADPSLTRPQPTDQLAVALLNNFPYTGTPVPQFAASNPKIMSAMTIRGATTQINLDVVDGLKPKSSYQVVLRPGPSTIATVTADANGSVSVPVTIPAATPAGFYIAHILGLNTANQQIDLYTTVYVAASADDYDGDGIPNTANQCGIVPGSGLDIDQDGVDDACDPYVGDPPTNNYAYRASLTNNTITATKP